MARLGRTNSSYWPEYSCRALETEGGLEAYNPLFYSQSNRIVKLKHSNGSDDGKMSN